MVAPQTSPAAARLALKVNGQAIEMAEVHEWLIEAYGAEAVNQMVSTAVVKQAAAEAGITVTVEDADAEMRLTLQRMSANADPSQYERLLAQVLARKQFPRVQWDMMIRRNAYLRKMALRQMEITDAMLTAEWNNRYGLKVQVRLIQCESKANARKILELLAAGETFEQLASKYSMLADSAVTGGMLPPFSRDDRELPDALRRAAFDLADGEVSGIIQVDRYFHLIQRVKSIPPQTDVAFEDVKEQLRSDIAERLIWRLQERILNDLMNRADIVLIDSLLKQTMLKAEAQSQMP